MRIADADTFFYYPDALVICDPRDREDRYVKRYPKLVIEVMSPSTEQFDQTDKFQDYQSLDSLEEYVLVAQDKMQVECRRRVRENAAQRWKTAFYAQGDRLVLQSIQLELAMAELYRGVGGIVS